ncbi:hypothetical protein AcW1_006927 [Taiwanofungus camphoratus]|nr:hypothetical protein AcV5_002736 [Antrodia cinnamomea]KAI0924975.1 hypothetical protein AcW2_005692 [Antrodia cinnamomea]KAI0946967.1 hypothetical protein AcV7_009535 [Antrodia cinnamomea]KAI0955309.1 hypothetical protein AcW1_006927 [Antrodia cinnamomea]
MSNKSLTICITDRTTAIGKMIDSYLRSQSELDDRAIHLLFSANRWELAPVIEEMLRAGTTVICDRYAFSGIAFSAAKEAAGLSYNWCRAPDIGLPAPDLTLFLDVSPEKAKARGGYGAERYEREDVQMRVRAVFERIGEEMGEQVGEDGRWVSIDADAGKEDVAETVWTLAERLCRGIDRPVSKLWVDDNEKERNSQMYM